MSTFEFEIRKIKAIDYLQRLKKKQHKKPGGNPCAIRIGDMVFPTITKAAEYFGVTKSVICAAIKRKKYKKMKIEKI